MVKKFFGADEKGELRKFALKLGLFLMISGSIFHRGQWAVSQYGNWAGLCLVLIAPALLFPRPLKPLRRGLQVLSRWAGLAVTALLLALVYFLILTPLGFIARLSGKKFLALGRDPQAKSYWVRRDPALESSPERQY